LSFGVLNINSEVSSTSLDPAPSGTSHSDNTGVPDFDHHTRDTTEGWPKHTAQPGHYSSK